jgi:hypothetical protein
MSLTIDARPRSFGVSSILFTLGFVFNLLEHLPTGKMCAP